MVWESKGELRAISNISKNLTKIERAILFLFELSSQKLFFEEAVLILR